MSSSSSCCLKSFAWEGTPRGRVDKLGALDCYIAGSENDDKRPAMGILFIHDLLGFTFPNTRILADHYAAEADATVYVPDFFGGSAPLPFEPILRGRFHEVDLAGFLARNARDIREPDILEAARLLRSRYARVGAVGFCWGGWACFRLGAREKPLVDCVSVGHPSLLTKRDIDEVAVPVQILAPEHDPAYTPELKTHTFETLAKAEGGGVYFDYLHLPGVEHGCLVRGDPKKPGEREAMARAKDAVVGWFRQFLHEN
ncbi:uncharacterized protein Z520_10330 [Fonsecaea multimorphosa CBS 102226]|uniref:Dienelactone hydrolase domain-containing protein n=1 Tax=Fonsecaea multimorphosa CBS 102226 TaxID=1442371 RepID=A0A0D2KBI7_9EURO|nr:uncharacterized protein Z520_10330 [Fonsecaea multimorphosa CBS 102226]KIX93993.1 hypothetical protein Z520_10330 [Fonsecaea multimorphosa CBS 102226]OAL19340.1 hypothetical protein AYO22_09884 [Fonsecaea multimorphosa]